MQETKNEFKFLTQDICREISSRNSKQNRVREGKGFKNGAKVSDVTENSTRMRTEVDSQHSQAYFLDTQDAIGDFYEEWLWYNGGARGMTAMCGGGDGS